MNPYASFLGQQDPQQVIASTPARLTELLTSLGADGTERSPAPGKWSPREILCHLADCEIVFAFRLRQTLAEDNPTIQPFDQDKWAAQYPGIPAAPALEAFTALRNWNLLLIQSALPAAAGKTMTHPERGTMTFQTVVETMAGHDLNHLAQLRHIAELTT
jgi:hypothetical protein